MSMKEHFKRECELLGWNVLEDPEEKELQQLIMEQVEDTLDLLSEQGHSGHSFPYFFRLLDRASHFKPLSPLTGAEDEWNHTSGTLFQNKRCSSIFKDGEETYEMDGYVFREPSGSCFTSRASRKYITFPYTPEEPVYLDVSEEATPEECASAVQQYELWKDVLTKLEGIPLRDRPVQALQELLADMAADALTEGVQSCKK